MRVMHALTTALPGGTEISVLRLLPRLRQRGIMGAVSILSGGGPLVERFEAAGIRVHLLGAERGWAHAWRRLARTLREEPVDVVHAYGFRMSLLARFAVRVVTPRPAVAHGIRGLHLTDSQNPDGPQARLARVVERAFGAHVDRYVANSESAVEFLVARGLPRTKFTVARNGIDTAAWQRTAVAEERSIACVASLRPVKRVGHLLDALGVLRTRGVDFRCTIAGDGPLRPTLERQVRALALERHVVWCGRVDEQGVADLLHATRVLVLPSLWEGMPVAIMEAMAAGVPVVACDVPGVRELVVHDRTGLLVDPHDVHGLAAALETLLADPERARCLGAEGRERVAREFSVDAQVEAHVRAYGSLAPAAAHLSAAVPAGEPR